MFFFYIQKNQSTIFQHSLKYQQKKLIQNLTLQIKPFKPDLILGEMVEKIKYNDDCYETTTSKNSIIKSKCIVIAAGNGAFGPNKPPICNIEEYEEKSIFYHIKDKNKFKDKKIAIAGGGDSAVDWAIELSDKAEKIYFIHRREKLRAAPSSVQKLYNIAKNNNLEIIVPYQIDSITGNNGKLDSLIVKDLDGAKKELKVNYFLPFFGLSSNLGPIKDWELQIEKTFWKLINLPVKLQKTEFSLLGIFAHIQES